MKVRVSIKDLKRAFPYAISLGYCAAQYLLSYKDPDFYTAGVYGWNFDAYKLYVKGIGYVLLTTGYRGMFGKDVDYKLLEEYDAKAEKVRFSNEGGADKVNALLDEFLSKTAGGWR